MEKEPPSGGSFLLGSEQKPRGAVRVRKKVAVIFYQKRKNFSAARQEYFGGEDAKSGLSPGGGRQAVLLFFRGGMRCVTRNFLIARGIFTMYHISLHKSTKNLHKING